MLTTGFGAAGAADAAGAGALTGLATATTTGAAAFGLGAAGTGAGADAAALPTDGVMPLRASSDARPSSSSDDDIAIIKKTRGRMFGGTRRALAAKGACRVADRHFHTLLIACLHPTMMVRMGAMAAY